MRHALVLIFTLALSLPVQAAVLPVTPGTTIGGEFYGDYAGEGIVGIGDFDGNLVPDIAVTARNYSPNGHYGAVLIIKNKPEGLPTNISLSSAVKIIGEYGDWLGTSLVTAGDNNKDKMKDLLVSSTSYVCLVRGSKTMTGAVPIVNACSVKFSGHRPSSVATGDFNGNGLSDYVFSTGDNGEIFLVLDSNLPAGTSVNLNANSIVIQTGTNPGMDVALAMGDVNKDGYDDIVSSAGIVFGNVVGTASLTTKFNILPRSIAVLNDMNGDGFKEIAIRGSYQYTSTHYTKFIKGRTTWPLSVDIMNDTINIEGLGITNPFLNTMISIGDRNGDGFNDTLFSDSSKNRVILIKGSPDFKSYTVGTVDILYTGIPGTGTSVAHIDNFFGGDGCGINKVDLIGAIGAGYGKAYVVNINK